ncbi:hemerythrin domain-containing protein [Streptomyces sp. NPDC007991]|uniref:hemerythrin domain-containing protein n=1 Tax=Streptomyces sp. NPDC007991 TaxID=3364803 RepID=UPI0036E0416C
MDDQPPTKVAVAALSGPRLGGARAVELPGLMTGATTTALPSKEEIVTTLTQQLHHEHEHLLPHIEALRTVADTVGRATPEALGTALADLQLFLADHLIPHAEAEERVLYPAVARVMGAAEATATMSREHAEVGRLARELGTLREAMGRDGLNGEGQAALRRVLYGLYTLVKVHFAKEEEIYLPLLEERLTASETEQLLAELAHSNPHR